MSHPTLCLVTRDADVATVGVGACREEPLRLGGV